MSFDQKYLKYKNKYLNLKKQIGGNPIVEEDILFRNMDVCILKPDVKKGILVYSHYTQPEGMPSLCEAGLKTGAQLKKEGIEFDRTMIHDCIFFRAPKYSNPIDYTSVDTEITSSFGDNFSGKKSLVWIRIDPARTYVYSSEIRSDYVPHRYNTVEYLSDMESEVFSDYVPHMYDTVEYLSDMESEVFKSKKSMNDYLRIIGENKTVEVTPGNRLFYNLYTSKVQMGPLSYILSYPLSSVNVNESSEVLVTIPHLTPNYFVKCT